MKLRQTKFYKFWGYKDYRKLLVANSISRWGDSIDAIAFSWMVYMLTGSEILLGVTFAVNSLPNLLFGLFTGVLADRFDKKKLIFYSFLGRGISVMVIGLLYYFGALRIWQVLLLTAVNSTLEILMSPAAFSMVPGLIGEGMYAEESAMSTSVYKFAELFGTAMAGVIVAKLGITGALFIDMLTFLAAALIISRINYKEEATEEKSKLNVANTISDIKEGFGYLKGNRIVLLSITLFAVINLCLAPINVMLPIFAEKILLGGPEVLSLLSISLSIGTILGGITTASMVGRIEGNKLIVLSSLSFGAGYGMLAMPGNVSGTYMLSLIIATLGFFIMGFMIPAMTAPLKGYLIEKTDKHLLGRISGIVSLVSTGIFPLGCAITGVVASYLSASLIFLIMGAIIMLTSMYLWIGGGLKNA